jgi:hypothetical protein
LRLHYDRVRATGMKLRDHPFTVYKGLPSWPPIWVRADDPSQRLSEGENGIITSVAISDLAQRRISLQMKDGDHCYLAHLYFDNYDFCLKAHQALMNCIGKTVKECGDLEIE